jgi:hypothetical protein
MQRGHEFQQQQSFWRVPNKYQRKDAKEQSRKEIPIIDDHTGLLFLHSLRLCSFASLR